MQQLTLSPSEALERVGELPGGPELLAAAAGRSDVELVGGAVRDLLLGRAPRELDVVVSGDLQEFVEELRARAPRPGAGVGAGASTTLHERFSTALVSWDGVRIDVAVRRAESYPRPGALPVVRAGDPDQDLARRDFTVNALALALGAPNRGALRAAEHAREDLLERRLRVLHEQSFRDDPTRLLRLARYAARLDFEIEAHTAELAAAAVADGALETVSKARIGAELRLALLEPDAVAALRSIESLGLAAAIDARLRSAPDERDWQAVRRGLALLPADGRADLLALEGLLLPIADGADPRRPAAAALPAEADPHALLEQLEFPAGDRDRAVAGAMRARGLARALAAAERPSQLLDAAAGAPPEAIALAGGFDEPAATAARRWLDELRHVRLGIDGDDLLAAGIPQGPDVGERLRSVLRARIDGEVGDRREDQLRLALKGPAR